MHDWDTAVAPTLRMVAELATQINSRADEIKSILASLPARPKWLTKAEDELRVAEQELTIALLLVRTARALYRQKPVIGEVA